MTRGQTRVTHCPPCQLVEIIPFEALVAREDFHPLVKMAAFRSAGVMLRPFGRLSHVERGGILGGGQGLAKYDSARKGASMACALQSIALLLCFLLMHHPLFKHPL